MALDKRCETQIATW